MFYSYYAWTELAYINKVLGTRLSQFLQTILKVLAKPLRSCHKVIKTIAVNYWAPL